MAYEADSPIITSYAIFIVIFLYFLIYSYQQDMTFRKKSDTSSDSVSKIMSCRFNCSVSDLVNHQYGICRMYSKENP